tara:strand:+ start:10034 stop:10174 length:141 start_codon:yes stop_codon:yes gene_type:complete
MEECTYCGCQFSVTFEDGDDEVIFCPACGTEMDEYEEGEEDYYEED